MVGVLGLTFALRLAALSGPTGGAARPALDPAPVVDALGVRVAGRRSPGSGLLAFPSAHEPAPTSGFTYHPEYRPQEWVALVADRLNMRDASVTHIALWVASWPLRFDASHERVTLRVTLPMP